MCIRDRGYIEQACGCATALLVRGEERLLPPQQQIVIFRVAQEVLNNAMKHADAKHITVEPVSYTHLDVYKRQFTLINMLMIAGAMLVGLSTWLYQLETVSASAWFMLTGLGMYMAYVPCTGLYFERLVATFRYVSTVGFIVTLADWYGYLGSVAVLMYKNFGQSTLSFQQFFIYGCYGLSGVYICLLYTSRCV